MPTENPFIKIFLVIELINAMNQLESTEDSDLLKAFQELSELFISLPKHYRSLFILSIKNNKLTIETYNKLNIIN